MIPDRDGGGPRPRGRGPSHDGTARVALAAAFAAALALRLWLWSHRNGTPAFEEDVPLAWAWNLWGFDAHGFDPNPHNAIWPHLSVYAFFLVQALVFAVGRVTGVWSGFADFRAAALLDPGLLRAVSMLAAIGIAMAVVVWTARLARRVAGPWGPAAVAWALALDPLFLRHALVVSPDMLLTLFVVLGLHACLDVLERGRRRDSLLGGLWLGLGVAAKYSPLLLAAPMIVAHAWRPGAKRGPRVLADGRLWAAAGVAVAAFACGSPFTIVDLVRRWSEFALGADVLVSGPASGPRTWAGPEFFGRLLPGDLGAPMLVLMAGGAVAALAARAKPRLVLLSFAAVYLAAFAMVPTAFARYLMPAYPPLLALAATLALRVPGRGRVGRIVGAAALTAAVAVVAMGGVRALAAARLPDSRALAGAWCEAHLPPGIAVACEFAGPDLPDRAARRALLAARGLSPRWRDALGRGAAFWLHPLTLSFPAPGVSTPFYLPADVAAFDAVVVSSGVSGRYLAAPERFPVQCACYAGLARYADMVYRTPNVPLAGPSITVYRLSPAARDSIAAWWPAQPAARSPALAAPLSAYQAQVFAQRARVLGAAGRYADASVAWRHALEWRSAPAAWRAALAVNDSLGARR